MEHHYKEYWRKHLILLIALLVIWALSSLGAGVLFADFLDQFHIGGFKLGFWFAQQGSIYMFVLIIFAYVFLMNKLDREFDVHEE